MTDKKSMKMSTRKGNYILLEDVMARATGEVIIRQIETNDEKRHYFILMIGHFFHLLGEAQKKGEDKVTFTISDFLE